MCLLASESCMQGACIDDAVFHKVIHHHCKFIRHISGYAVADPAEDMKCAIDKAPKLTKGDWVLALQHALDMMRKSQTRIDERDWHNLSKQLWQNVDEDFDQSEEEDSHSAAGAKEELDEMNTQSAIMGEMAGETIQTNWM